MTNQFVAGVVARLHRLADQLTGLRERVRAAVATEAGRAVGEAVRDLFTAAVGGRVPLPPAYPLPTPDARPGRFWDDEADGWDRDDEGDEFGADTRPSDSPPQPGWAAALAGAEAARWWAARTGRAWVGAGLGVLTAAAGAAGNPVVRAALAVLTAVADLAAGAQPLAPPAI